MSEKITCPITLGEYERIMNDKKEHKCNCNGKCKVCKCKSKEELNIYDRLNEGQKEIVRSVCEERNLKIEDCKMERQVSPLGKQTPNLLIKSDTVIVLISNLFNEICEVGDEECQNH